MTDIWPDGRWLPTDEWSASSRKWTAGRQPPMDCRQITTYFSIFACLLHPFRDYIIYQFVLYFLSNVISLFVIHFHHEFQLYIAVDQSTAASASIDLSACITAVYEWLLLNCLALHHSQQSSNRLAEIGRFPMSSQLTSMEHLLACSTSSRGSDLHFMKPKVQKTCQCRLQGLLFIISRHYINVTSIHSCLLTRRRWSRHYHKFQTSLLQLCIERYVRCQLYQSGVSLVCSGACGHQDVRIFSRPHDAGPRKSP